MHWMLFNPLPDPHSRPSLPKSTHAHMQATAIASASGNSTALAQAASQAVASKGANAQSVANALSQGSGSTVTPSDLQVREMSLWAAGRRWDGVGYAVKASALRPEREAMLWQGARVL